MNNTRYKWDFFIAHAGADTAVAEKLYRLLAPHSRVFLDSQCLTFGDNWDQELQAAQRASKITIVLISPHTDAAYYAREEVAAAIDMARRNKDEHRVIPFYSNELSLRQGNLPYGLRLKHSIVLSESYSLEKAVDDLLALLSKEAADSVSQGDSLSKFPVESPVYGFRRLSMTIFKDKRVGVKAAIVTSVAIVLAACIQAIVQFFMIKETTAPNTRPSVRNLDRETFLKLYPNARIKIENVSNSSIEGKIDGIPDSVFSVLAIIVFVQPLEERSWYRHPDVDAFVRIDQTGSWSSDMKMQKDEFNVCTFLVQDSEVQNYARIITFSNEGPFLIKASIYKSSSEERGTSPSSDAGRQFRRIQLSGTILDDGRKPIEGAEIDIIERFENAYSDSRGHFLISISDVTESRLTILVKKTGYTDWERVVEMNESSISLDVRLRPIQAN